MPAITNIPSLGEGIYSIPDISRILSLPQTKVRRWVKEYWDGKFDGPYSRGDGIGKTVNFHTLIELFAFSQLRKEGVPAKRILTAHEKISQIVGTQYPFASDHILTDGKNVLFNPDVNTIIQADESLQYTISEFIRPFCKKVVFGEEHLVAKLWPLGRDKSIIVDPKHTFGQPTIEGTNIKAETIYRMFQAGESLHFIASLYEIETAQVEDAVTFCKLVA